MAQSDTFSRTARWLHWLVAGLIVLQYVLAEAAEEAASDLAALALLAQHKSVGITVLVLAIIRLAWRLRASVPAWPQSMPVWQHTASRVSHWAFYALLLALPLSGWLLSSAAAYSVSWFNLLPLPDLVAPSEGLEAALETLHEGLAEGLFVLALVHVAAALKHLLIDRDGVFQRMWSWLPAAAAILLVAAGITVLMPGTSAPPGIAPAPLASENRFTAAPHAPWQVDYARSTLRFTAEQAGAPFEGTWNDWQADIRMQGPGEAFSTEVTIRTEAVTTGDAARDGTLQDADWFDVANHPVARFTTDTLRKMDDDGFEATGNLSIRGRSAPVVFRFTLDEHPDGSLLLNGTADLDRLKLGVGTGEWLDTTWIGAAVTVTVTLYATRS